MKCVICKKEIPTNKINGWYQGNNAEPVKRGRCCDECNLNVVVPTRLKIVLGGNQ